MACGFAMKLYSGRQYTFYDADFHSSRAVLTVFKLSIKVFHQKKSDVKVRANAAESHKGT